MSRSIGSWRGRNDGRRMGSIRLARGSYKSRRNNVDNQWMNLVYLEEWTYIKQPQR